MTNTFLENKIKEILKTPAQNFLTSPKTAIKLLNMLFNTDQVALYKSHVVENFYSSQSQKIRKGHYLGFIELAKEKLPVFLFEHQGTVNAKISLLTEIPKILGDLNFSELDLPKDYTFVKNALIIFIPLAKHENNWKLSLVSSFSEKATTYKRHSYILGPDAQIRVALNELYIKLRNELEQSGTISFDKLKQAFEPEPLTKQFYQELIAWFYWAHQTVKFPIGDGSKKQDKVNQEALVRFLTRILFIWFLKQKKLIPNKLFELNYLSKILKNSDKLKDSKETIYYKAILQNLFFATLSVKVNERKFRDQQRFFKGYNKDFGNQYVYRFLDLFTTDEKEIKSLFKDIPFLNGGLFEVLDKSYIKDGKRVDIYYDGFTERKQYQPEFPDYLFFAEEHKERLNVYKKEFVVAGLFNILNRYHFTVTENTPLDKDVALDPELLGHIFENLLAEQLEETQQNARKQTGSFYTPHEIVDFMVEESLKEYLKTHLITEQTNKEQAKQIKNYLEQLFEPAKSLEDIKKDLASNIDIEELNNKTINLLSTIKIIDPAVGSGAFPMGILNKIVFLLQKLDPNNKKWKQEQLQKLESLDMPDNIKEEQKQKLLETFNQKDADYTRKLYLIRDSIYGVDIQPIAIQIARLRFFLSLIVDEKQNKSAENFGIQPLPNLYMNFVIANSLIPLDYTMDKINPLKTNNQLTLNTDSNIDKAKEEWFKISKDLYWVTDHVKKEKLKEKEKQARLKLAQALKGNYAKDYERIKNWDPYNPHKSANWFDPLFMLRVENGFDIVIANPPYVRQELIRNQKPLLKAVGYQVFNSTSDLYTYFYERAYQILKNKGVLTFISSNKFLRARYGTKLREFLASNMKIIKLIDFKGYKVFSATVDTLILIAKKIKPQNFYDFLFVNMPNTLPNNTKIDKYILQNLQPMNSKYLAPNIWLIVPLNQHKLKEKIEKIGTPLKDWDVNIYRGILTGFNEAFIIDGETRQKILNNCKTEEERKRTKAIIKPVLRGRDIKRYYYKWAELYLILIPAGWTNKNRKNQNPEEFFKSQFSSIYNYLKEIGDNFEKNSSGRRKGLYKRDDMGDYWWELRHCDYYKEFEKEKIVWQRISQNIDFSIVNSPFFVLDSMFIVTGTGLKFIISVLNSKLALYWIKNNAALLGTGSYGAKIYIEQLPIPKILPDQQKPFIELVDKILELTNKEDYENRPDLQKKVEEYNKEIDQMVYKLYRLSEEEIKLVERG